MAALTWGGEVLSAAIGAVVPPHADGACTEPYRHVRSWCLFAAAEVGGVVLVIDAKSERVADWYASYGAVPLADAPLTLMLPLATVEAALALAKKL